MKKMMEEMKGMMTKEEMKEMMKKETTKSE
jgi:hypothetical protein